MSEKVIGITLDYDPVIPVWELRRDPDSLDTLLAVLVGNGEPNGYKQYVMRFTNLSKQEFDNFKTIINKVATLSEKQLEQQFVSAVKQIQRQYEEEQ